MVGIMAISLSSASGSRGPTFTLVLLMFLYYRENGDMTSFTFSFGRET